MNATLLLRWKVLNVHVDGIINVTLYKCDVDRPDCTRCLLHVDTAKELDCTWCNGPSTSSCIMKDLCQSNGIQQQICTDSPIIISITPESGPKEGGTEVEIIGLDLGQTFTDIHNITLAGTICDHSGYEKDYDVGGRVSCKSGKNNETVDSDKFTSGPVVVYVLGLNTFGQGSNFSYTNPKIESFNPSVGPISGGTLVQINGVHLDTGKNRTVDVGGVCVLQNNNSTTVICTTNAGEEGNKTLIMMLDGNQRDGGMFEFKMDPIVSQISPQKAIYAGGNMLTVRGERFDIIANPKIQVTCKSGSKAMNVAECIPKIDSNDLLCLSPAINCESRKRKRQASNSEGTSVTIGFIMDGVKDLLNWSESAEINFQYFSNPHYSMFANDPQEFDTILFLSGLNLNLGSSGDDVTVFVGTEVCTEITIGTDTLTCKPPSSSPESGDKYGNRKEKKLPYVIVQHGNLEFDIGYLTYRTNTSIPTIVIIIMSVVIIVLVIVISSLVLILIRRKQKKTIQDIELHIVGFQSDLSENLKSLFATLQTTMHDFYSEVEGQDSVPLVKKETYLSNMLFLGLEVQPTLLPSEDVLDNAEIGSIMASFSKLLSNNAFLEVLIRTLNNSHNINSMKKVNIASLISLSSLLDAKLKPLTEVMFNLMKEEIEDLDDKLKYKVLFSRNGTVLEKLISNWIAICLHDTLEKQVSVPLYKLISAITNVCQMGPVDAVTGKSQFSLSHEEMLDIQIPFEKIDIKIITNESSGETTAISVLNINSITQVKHKMISTLYKDTPYSQRPLVDNYDLVWRAGHSGQIVVRDDSYHAGNVENGWKKITTFEDIGVSSGGRFELVEKQNNSNANASSLTRNQDGLLISSWRDPSQDRIVEFEGDAEDGINIWHLVKDETSAGENTAHNEKDKGESPVIKEVVLPFLPATRNYINSYLETFFGSILSTEGDAIPHCIRYMFEFFDEQASTIDENALAKTWKDNVLLLRYWATILAHPRYVFDISVYSYTHACLRTLVQLLSEVCNARINTKTAKNFSPSRVLYANHIPQYNSMLQSFYLYVRNTGNINSEDMSDELQQIEKEFRGTYDLVSTQYQLFKIVKEHATEITEALNTDYICSEINHAETLQQLLDSI